MTLCARPAIEHLYSTLLLMEKIISQALFTRVCNIIIRQYSRSFLEMELKYYILTLYTYTVLQF